MCQDISFVVKLIIVVTHTNMFKSEMLAWDNRPFPFCFKPHYQNERPPCSATNCLHVYPIFAAHCLQFLSKIE